MTARVTYFNQIRTNTNAMTAISTPSIHGLAASEWPLTSRFRKSAQITKAAITPR
jgi:hypothetical protein